MTTPSLGGLEKLDWRPGGGGFSGSFDKSIVENAILICPSRKSTLSGAGDDFIAPRSNVPGIWIMSVTWQALLGHHTLLLTLAIAVASMYYICICFLICDDFPYHCVDHFKNWATFGSCELSVSHTFILSDFEFLETLHQ